MIYRGRTACYHFPADTKILTCRVFKRKLVAVLSTGHIIQCRGDFDHQELVCSSWSSLSKKGYLQEVRRIEYVDLEHAMIEFVTDSEVFSVTFSEAVERDYLDDPNWHTPLTSAITLAVMDIKGGDPLDTEEFQHEDTELCNSILQEFHTTNKQNCL